MPRSGRWLQLTAASLLGLAFVLASGTAHAQAEDDDAFDHAGTLRQIRRNMAKIEEELGRLGPHDPKTGEKVIEDIDRVLDQAKKRGDQIVSDIDTFLDHLKC